MMQNKQAGFVALTSILIMGSVALLLAASGSMSGFVNRSLILEREYKLQSAALAHACIETLLLRLQSDALYGGDEVVRIGENSCTIFPRLAGLLRTFQIQAVYQHAYTNVRAQVDIESMTLVSLEEVPNL